MENFTIDIFIGFSKAISNIEGIIIGRFSSIFEVFNNVVLANQNAEESEVKIILKETGLYDMKEKIAGENGKHLSGRQRQRISLARALLKNTPILIMEEPTNSLDIQGQKIIKTLLEDQNKTIILVTHKEILRDKLNKNFGYYAMTI